MGSGQLRITSDIVEEVFREICFSSKSKGEIRNKGDIELAIFKVNNERDVFGQAATAMYYIAKTHPFTDANKRTAIALAELILNKQGYKIQANPEVTLRLLQKIAKDQGKIEKRKIEEIKKWVKKHAVELKLG